MKYLKNKQAVQEIKLNLKSVLQNCQTTQKSQYLAEAKKGILEIKQSDKKEWKQAQNELEAQHGKDLVSVRKIRLEKKISLGILRRNFVTDKKNLLGKTTDKQTLKKELKLLKKDYRLKKKNTVLSYNNKIHHIFPNYFQQLFTLTKLNLSDSDSNEKALRHTGFRYVILFLFGLIVGSYLAYGFFSLFKGTTSLDISPQKPFIEVIISLLLIMSILSSSFLLSKKLFEDKRNNIIQTFPVKQNVVYFSKLLASYLIELKKSTLVYASLFTGYSFTFHYIISFRYFVVVVMLLFVIPFVTICLGQFLSFIVYTVRKILNKNLLSYTLIGFAIFLLIISLINKLIFHFEGGRSEITRFDILLSLHNLFNMEFYQLLKASQFTKVIKNILFFSGSNLNYLTLVGIISLCVLLTLVSPYVYTLINKINFSIFESNFSFHKQTEYYKTPLYFTQLLKESRETTRDLKQVVSIMIYTFLMPLIFYFLNKFFKLLTLSNEGLFLVLVGELLMGMLILTSGNFLSATIISREEQNLYFLKSNPRSILSIIAAKLTLPIIINFVVIILNFILNEFTGVIPFKNNLGMHLIFTLGVILHTIWVSEIDIVSPDEQSYKDSDNIQDNKNIFKSIFIGIIITGITVGLSVILRNTINATIPILPVSLILLAFIIYRLSNLVIKASAYLRWNA